MSAGKFYAGEKVSHARFGEGFIRVLKPFEKSFVEFIGKNNGSDEDSHCVWVKNSELVKAN